MFLFQVCKQKFNGFAELRDHVQTHGDSFRDPYGDKDKYNAARRIKRKAARDEARTNDLQREIASPSHSANNLNSPANIENIDENALDSSEFAVSVLNNIIEEVKDIEPEKIIAVKSVPVFLEKPSETLLSEPGREEPNKDELFDL